jgi:hypothetical protein
MNEKEKKIISKEALIHHMVRSDSKSCRKVSRAKLKKGGSGSNGPSKHEKKG